MLIYMLFIISLIINTMLILLYCKNNKKLHLSYKIRIGYEKKCNSFRIRYNILSRMENPDLIVERVKKLKKAFYIYGGGVIGKKLSNILLSSPELQPLGFIDGKKLESQNPTENIIDKNAAIIVTPIFDYDNIVKLLSVFTDKNNIISIDDIL